MAGVVDNSHSRSVMETMTLPMLQRNTQPKPRQRGTVNNEFAANGMVRRFQCERWLEARDQNLGGKS